MRQSWTLWKGTVMTTLVIMRAPINGDPKEMAERYTSDPEMMAALQQVGVPEGVIRHRTYAADGELVVVDEWERPEQFQAWMKNPDVQRILAALGVGKPEVTFAEQMQLGDEVG
jgi:hypothetical protein